MNIPGLRTKKKLVIIESDDWGSIRIPSLEISKKLIAGQLVNSNDPYAKFDCLESNEDMNALFETLLSVKDSNGNHPVITANTIVANPDFNKIRESNFTEYYFEPFTETLNNYSLHDKVYDNYKSGIEQKIFIPQFHGREHLNIAAWMKYLRNNDKRFKLAFDYKTFAIDINKPGLKRNNLMASFDYSTEEEKNQRKKILLDGYQLFNKLFGFNSTSFIAPCFIWDDEIELQLKELGVQNIQTTAIQGIPKPHSATNKKCYHYSGEKNKCGQYYFIRNCFFEPAMSIKNECVNATLKSIDIAFKWGKPAIISSHRLNYIGTVDQNNRSENLKLLKRLLQMIIAQWPDVEFCSTNQLIGILIKA